MTTAKPAAEFLAVLPMPPHTYLTPDQARRATCLALVLTLTRSRNVQISTIWAMAEWMETGATLND